jgi:hypothetical protein
MQSAGSDHFSARLQNNLLVKKYVSFGARMIFENKKSLLAKAKAANTTIEMALRTKCPLSSSRCPKKVISLLSFTPIIGFFYKSKNKKPARRRALKIFFGITPAYRVLFRMNCFNRANIRANTTIGAKIGVNLVDITLGDSLNGTFVNAAATSGAIVVNYISHFERILISKKETSRCKSNSKLFKQPRILIFLVI